MSSCPPVVYFLQCFQTIYDYLIWEVMVYIIWLESFKINNHMFKLWDFMTSNKGLIVFDRWKSHEWFIILKVAEAVDFDHGLLKVFEKANFTDGKDKAVIQNFPRCLIFWKLSVTSNNVIINSIAPRIKYRKKPYAPTGKYYGKIFLIEFSSNLQERVHCVIITGPKMFDCCGWHFTTDGVVW